MSGEGLAGAIGLRAGAAPETDEAEQPDMLADAPLLGSIVRPGEKEIPRGPGRPKGARNKRTEELARYILGRYRDPLIGLASIISTPIEQLAKDLACSRLEAADFWRKCAGDLTPYLHQRQPQQVSLEGASAGMLVIVQHAPAAPGASGPMLGTVIEIEENQGVSEAEGEPSHEQSSHEEGK